MGSIKRAALLAALALLATPAAAGATPTWLAPGALSAPGQDAEYGDVAMAEDGAAAASWQRSNGANEVVEVAVRQPFGQFGAALKLSPPAEDCFFAQVAVDGGGEVLVVWENAGNGAIEGASVVGGLASAPITLSTGSGTAEAPAIAIDEHGAAVVAWVREAGSEWLVEARYRPAGGQFGATQTLSAKGEFGEHPRVAIDAAGEATVVWNERAAGGKMLVKGATRTSAASHFAVAPISASFESTLLPFPAIATDAAGDTAVGWVQSGVLHLMERPAGGQLAPVELPEAKAAEQYLAVGVDSAGEPSVAWTGEYPLGPSVDFASGPKGGPLSPPRAIAPLGLIPSLAENATGDMLIVYEPEIGETAAASYRPAGGVFEAPVIVSPAEDTIETGGPGLETQLSVALDGQGDGLVGYAASPGSGVSVMQSMLDAGGPLLEGLSIPANGVEGSPVSFAVTPKDQLSAVASTTWAFGDASTATGASVTHTFAKPGTYSVLVTSTDANGNSTTQAGKVTIAAKQGNGGSKRPGFKGAHVVSHKVKVGRSGVARLRVKCPSSSGCKGKVTLSFKTKAAGLGLPVTAIVGHDVFRAKAGGSASVTFKLSKPLLKLLRKHHRLKMAVQIEAQDVYRTPATTHGKVTVVRGHA
ncbi:MAG TPA: PKD domain-containing protein [Solirubrobacteraceae bacterium]|jgi:hypothetical protein